MSMLTYHARTKAPEGPAPLIFAFHGTGGDENQFFSFARELRPGAGVISPRGDVAEGMSARFFRRTGEGVYDMSDLARATAKTARFVEAWKAEHPDCPIYGFGYSNGANILASVMMRRPDLFDRIGLLHPLIPWRPDSTPGLAGKPVLITAGQRDPICPWPMTEQLESWARQQGADVRLVAHEGGHELHREEALALAELFKARSEAEVA
ncbi:MAG: alpha/beta hydrolase [Pseudomonadota bacterium]